VVESIELMVVARRCPSREPGALWVQEWCAKLMAFRKDLGLWLAMDHQRYARDLAQARALARVWIHRPHDGDEVVRLWKDLEKNFAVWKQHPLVQLRGMSWVHWEQALLKEGDDLHLESLRRATSTLKTWNDDLRVLEDRCSNAGEWMFEAGLDLEGEQHAKTRNRKQKAMEELQALEVSSRQNMDSLLTFLDRVESTKAQWANWGGTRERILEEEKPVEVDKLSSVLSQAWGVKTGRGKG